MSCINCSLEIVTSTQNNKYLNILQIITNNSYDN